KQGVCITTIALAKKYYQLINDGVFFIPDARDRVGKLLEKHLSHPLLAASVALEMETGKIELKDPPRTRTFQVALLDGGNYPVQSCLYLAHRARIYILRAIVDYWLARSR